MTSRFSAVKSPNSQLLAQISALAPQSPFDTPAYAAALSARHAVPCALLLQEEQQITGGCLAALAGRKWNRRLEIFSAPCLTSPATFWDGVIDFCRSHDICDLDVQTFAAISPDMPHLDSILSKRERSEYIIDLSAGDYVGSYSKNHKRSINKANKSFLRISSGNALGNYKEHVKLMRESMTRRSERGESVPIPSAQDFDFALIRSGAGQLFQATLDSRVLASILILKSATTGYYHSAGTSPEGMHLGASPFLISEVAKILSESNFKSFNLGGVDPGADGLRRFKSGFGAEEIKLVAACFSMISPLYRALRLAARKAKAVPRTLLAKFHF